jgi:hypothetical protein
LKKGTTESSRPGWKNAKPDVYAAGKAVIPSFTEVCSSMQVPQQEREGRVQSNHLMKNHQTRKAGKDTHIRIPVNLLPQRKVEAEEVMLTQNQLK